MARETRGSRDSRSRDDRDARESRNRRSDRDDDRDDDRGGRESRSRGEGRSRRRSNGDGDRDGEKGRQSSGRSSRSRSGGKKEMLINALQPEEVRIAIVEDGRLEELYVERDSQGVMVNNIYKGRVVNILPTIQAAFVDFGAGGNGFLHISDVEASYFPDYKPPQRDDDDRGGRPRRRPNERSISMKPPIQQVFRNGSEVLVQVIKESIGTKGPTLSTYISIPGRYLVLMPHLKRTGVSKKIEDERERRKLKRMLREIDPPEGLGFIIRTAGVGRSVEDLKRDMEYLLRLWKRIVKNIEQTGATGEVYAESDMIQRTIRDIYSSDIDTIYIDEPEAHAKAVDFVKSTMPTVADRVKLFDKPLPIFHDFKVERDIEEAQRRTVQLEGGASIVIDQTEALVAIDVNSGKYRASSSDPEQTALEVNLLAADEIARQLRLRDIGGVVVNDFIDMRADRNRRKVQQRLEDALSRDRARTKVLRVSPFGLIEMTRQRIRPSLRKSVYQDCPCCDGVGFVKTEESMAIEVMRLLMTVSDNKGVTEAEVECQSDVAHHLTNVKRRALTDFEEEYEVDVRIKGRNDVSPEHLIIRVFDDNAREMNRLTIDKSHEF